MADGRSNKSDQGGVSKIKGKEDSERESTMLRAVWGPRWKERDISRSAKQARTGK